MDVQMPDGTLVQGVPEGTTREQLLEKLKNKDQADKGIDNPSDTPAKSKFEQSPAGKLTSVVGGVLDVGLAAASGTAANIAGGLAGAGTPITNAMGITDVDPVAVIRAWQQKAYTPVSAVGQKIAGGLSKASEATLGKAGRMMGDYAYDVTRSPLAATIAEMLPDIDATIAGAKVPPAFRELATQGAAKIARDALLNQTKTDAMRTARQAGFKVSPAAYGGRTGRYITGMSNKAEIERELSADNQKRIVELAKVNLDIPSDAPLDRATYAAARLRLGLPYERARSLAPMTIDAEFLADLYAAGHKFEQLTADFKPDELVELEQKIAQHRGTYLQPMWSADSAVNMMQFLRESAADLLRSESSVDRKLGFVQRETAQAFEDRLWRHANDQGQPQLASEFQQARKKLAQLHVWEDATNFDTGYVSPRALVAQRATSAARVDPFTDELKMATDAAGAFPQSFQDMASKGGTMPISVFERYMLVGGAGAGLGELFGGASGSVEGASLALAVAGSGIAGRAAMTSDWWQRAMMKPQAVAPGAVRGALMASGPVTEGAAAATGAESGVQQQ